MDSHPRITALKIVVTKTQTNWIMFKKISVWLNPRNETVVQEEDRKLEHIREKQAEWLANKEKQSNH